MLLAPITILWWRLGQASRAEKSTLSPIELGNLVRNTLTRWMKNGLLACGVVIAWTLIDTVGGTLYAVQSSGALARWGASVFTLLAGLGAFARSALVLLTPSRGRRGPTVPPVDRVVGRRDRGRLAVVGHHQCRAHMASHGDSRRPTASLPDSRPVCRRRFSSRPDRCIPTGNQLVITAASTSLPPCTAPASQPPNRVAQRRSL